MKLVRRLQNKLNHTPKSSNLMVITENVQTVCVLTKVLCPKYRIQSKTGFDLCEYPLSCHQCLCCVENETAHAYLVFTICNLVFIWILCTNVLEINS